MHTSIKFASSTRILLIGFMRTQAMTFRLNGLYDLASYTDQIINALQRHNVLEAIIVNQAMYRESHGLQFDLTSFRNEDANVKKKNYGRFG